MAQKSLPILGGSSGLGDVGTILRVKRTRPQLIYQLHFTFDVVALSLADLLLLGHFLWLAFTEIVSRHSVKPSLWRQQFVNKHIPLLPICLRTLQDFVTSYLFLELFQIILNGVDGPHLFVLIELSFDFSIRCISAISLGILIRHDKLFTLFGFHLYLLQSLLNQFIESLQIFMADIALDGYFVDLGQKIGLIDVLMGRRIGLVVVEVGLLHLPLPVIQQTLYLLHVDYPINLSRRQLAQPVLPTLQNHLLVHPALLPIVWQVLLLQLLLQ